MGRCCTQGRQHVPVIASAALRLPSALAPADAQSRRCQCALWRSAPTPVRLLKAWSRRMSARITARPSNPSPSSPSASTDVTCIASFPQAAAATAEDTPAARRTTPMVTGWTAQDCPSPGARPSSMASAETRIAIANSGASAAEELEFLNQPGAAVAGWRSSSCAACGRPFRSSDQPAAMDKRPALPRMRSTNAAATSPRTPKAIVDRV